MCKKTDIMWNHDVKWNKPEAERKMPSLFFTYSYVNIYIMKLEREPWKENKGSPGKKIKGRRERDRETCMFGIRVK